MIRRFWFPFAFACAIGVFLLMTNNVVAFANGGSCDPWYFFGRFFNGDQLATLSQSRESSRLPLFMLGYVLNRVFSGIAADYANFLILFVAASAPVYFATRRLFGITAALIAVIFFSTSPQIISNFSVTFSAPAIAASAIAMLLAVAASTTSSRANRVYLLLAAGFFWAAAIHGHLFSLSFNFAVALYCLDWSRRPFGAFLRELAEKWCLLLGGALLATAFIGLINVVVLHGSFLFFLNQYNAIYTVNIQDYEKPNWYLNGGRGALLLAGIAATAVQWLWVARRGIDAPGIPRYLTALIPFSAILLVQIGYRIAGGLPLQYDYYFAFIMPSLALLVGSLVPHATLNRSLTIAAVAGYLVLSLAGDFGRPDLVIQTLTTFPPSLVLAIVFALLLLWLPRHPTASVLAALLLCGGLNATIRPEGMGSGVWYSGDFRDGYSRLHTGMAFLSRFRFTTMPKFWLSAGTWEMLAYPRSFDYCWVDTALPAFQTPKDPNYNPNMEKFAAGDELVMIPKDAAAYTGAEHTLATRGLRFDELGRHDVDFAGTSYLIVLGTLQTR